MPHSKPMSLSFEDIPISNNNNNNPSLILPRSVSVKEEVHSRCLYRLLNKPVKGFTGISKDSKVQRIADYVDYTLAFNSETHVSDELLRDLLRVDLTDESVVHVR